MEKLYKVRKTRLGYDRSSDHELLIAKFRPKLKNIGKTTGLFGNELNQIPYYYTVEVTNKFMGLDVIDRMPEGLWMEVGDFVQEAVIKTIPKNKKCKKAKGCLRRPYKELRNEEKLKTRDKRKDIPI